MKFMENEREIQQKKLEEVYEQYKNLMYHVAYGILRNHHDAEDAVLRALWKISENILKIDETICPKTKHFVVTVTERQAIDIYRGKKRLGETSLDDYGERLSDDFVCGGEMEPSALSLAIAGLPKNYREVILLRFADGYSVKEISEILGYSVSKVEKLISRGKTKLRAALKEADE